MERETLQERSRRYSLIKYRFAIFEGLYSCVLLAVFLGSGASVGLAGAVTRALPSYLRLPSYLAIGGLIFCVLQFPFAYYVTYRLEQRFALSTQSFVGWIADQCKGACLSYIIGLILFAAFYLILARFTDSWWLAASLFWILFSVVLSKLAPVLIIPIFFKSTPLSDEALRARIAALAEKMRIKIMDVFEINFSAKTVKANAALAGIGSTRRVLLSDTLKGNYTADEVEAIVAHEFAHYTLRHMMKLIAVNAAATGGAFYLMYKESGMLARWWGGASLSDIASLPAVILFLSVCGIALAPLTNAISRRCEENADLMALEVTRNPQAFISLMEKLADQNLADRNPPWLVKMYFYDHPPIDERIAQATLFLP